MIELPHSLLRAVCIAGVVLTNMAVVSPEQARVHAAQPATDIADREAQVARRGELWQQSLLLARQSKFDEALALAQEILQLEKQLFGDEGQEIVGTLEYLASLHLAQEDFPSSRRLRVQVLELRTALHGEDDWRTADARQEIANIDLLSKLSLEQKAQLAGAAEANAQAHRLAGEADYAGAAEQMQRALTLTEQVLGKDHPLYCQTLTELASAYYTLSDFARAEALCRDALQIRKRVLGDAHPLAATSASNLAQVLFAQGKLAEAQPLFAEALQLRVQLLGEEHAESLASKQSLMLVERDLAWSASQQFDSQGNLNQAAQELEKVVQRQRLLVGKDDESVAAYLGHLASVQLQRDDLPAARQAREAILEIVRTAHGDDSWRTADARLELAYLDRVSELTTEQRAQLLQATQATQEAFQNAQQGNYADAIATIEEVLLLRRRIFGHEHPHYSSSLHDLGQLYAEMGLYGPAVQFYQKGQGVLRAVHGEGHPVHAESLEKLGRLYQRQGDYASAQGLFEQVLQSRQRLFGESSEPVAASLSNLARLANARADYDKAETAYEAALDIRAGLFGSDHPRVASLQRRLTLLERDRLVSDAQQLEEAGQLRAAAERYEQALSIQQSHFADSRQPILALLERLADLYRRQHDWESAGAALRQSLELAVPALGQDDWRAGELRRAVADLEHLARFDDPQLAKWEQARLAEQAAARHEAAGELAKAIGEKQRARQILREIWGERHHASARVLHQLATLTSNHGDTGTGESLFLKSQLIARDLLEQTHPVCVSNLQSLAAIYRDRAEQLAGAEDFAAAVPVARRRLKVERRLLGDGHPNIASALEQIGRLQLGQEDFAAALTTFREALALRQTNHGDDHWSVAQLRTRIEILEKHSPPQLRQLEQAETAHRRASELYYQGDYLAAFAVADQAVQIRQDILGARHPLYAASLNARGQLHAEQGNYIQARKDLEEAHQILREAETYPRIETMNNLGGLYWKLGEYDDGLTLLDETIQALEQWSDDYPAYAEYYSQALDNRAAAINLLFAAAGSVRLDNLKALEVRRRALGLNHVTISRSLSNLADNYEHLGENEIAEAFHREVLAVSQRLVRPDHPVDMRLLEGLASFLVRQQKYAEAEEHFEKILAVHERQFGRQHEAYVQVLAQLTQIYARTGRGQRALELTKEAVRLRSRIMDGVFRGSSERTMRSMLFRAMLWELSGLEELLLVDRPSGEAAEVALLWTLQRKAVVLDALAQLRKAQRLTAEDEVIRAHNLQWQQARQEAHDLAVSPPEGVAADQLRQRRLQLQRGSADLESELNRLLAERLGEPALAQITIEQIRNALDKRSVLVEFLEIQPGYHFDLSVNERPFQYVAFVVPGDLDAPIRMVPLAESGQLEKPLKDFWLLFPAPTRGQDPLDPAPGEESSAERLRRTSRELYERLFAPLEEHLGPADVIYLAPDSDLHQLPFEALVDRQDQYLLKRFRFAYLSTGRDLLRSGEATGVGTYVLGGPDFDAPARQRQELAAALVPELLAARSTADAARVTADTGEAELARRGGLQGQRSGDLPDVPWEPLPGALEEARSIKEILDDTPFGPVSTYVGRHALEEVLKAVPTPRVLVIASHGFFLPDQPSPWRRDSEAPPSRRTDRLAVLDESEDPLLRSGLVLAGANQYAAAPPDDVRVDDGWVTAAEIAQLELSGTDLIVLSACETGRGSVNTGAVVTGPYGVFNTNEAVSGLRRAFQLAGARNMIVSLSKVPDRETQQFMDRFYRHLERGQSKIDALHETKLEVISERAAGGQPPHPVYWASFILIGAER